jgi:hypothetical protein
LGARRDTLKSSAQAETVREALDHFGKEERTARLRALAALCLCYAKASGNIIRQLRAAENDATALDLAMAELERIPALPRRRIIAGFMRLHSAADAAPSTCGQARAALR